MTEAGSILPGGGLLEATTLRRGGETDQGGLLHLGKEASEGDLFTTFLPSLSRRGETGRTWSNPKYSTLDHC